MPSNYWSPAPGIGRNADATRSWHDSHTSNNDGPVQCSFPAERCFRGRGSALLSALPQFCRAVGVAHFNSLPELWNGTSNADPWDCAILSSGGAYRHNPYPHVKRAGKRPYARVQVQGGQLAALNGSTIEIAPDIVTASQLMTVNQPHIPTGVP